MSMSSTWSSEDLSNTRITGFCEAATGDADFVDVFRGAGAGEIGSGLMLLRIAGASVVEALPCVGVGRGEAASGFLASAGKGLAVAALVMGWLAGTCTVADLAAVEAAAVDTAAVEAAAMGEDDAPAGFALAALVDIGLVWACETGPVFTGSVKLGVFSSGLGVVLASLAGLGGVTR